MERLKNVPFSTDSMDKKMSEPSLFIKSNGALFLVLVNDILYCEAMKKYTKIVIKNGTTYYPLISFSKFEEDLNTLTDSYLRIHRSFIVSQKYLSAIGTNYVLLDDVKIPIGHQFKEVFLTKLGAM